MFPVVRRARLAAPRRLALAAVAVTALVAAVAPVLAGGPGSVAEAAPVASPNGSAAAAPLLTTSTFADPPTGVRPMYRWWMPLGFTDDDELRAELRDMAASGAGGVEVSPFIVPGPGNQTNAFLSTYGWGTPLWAHKIEVITAEAAKLGLIVDQNLGPAYPATVPSLNSFNQRQAEQQVIYGREFNAAGTTRSGTLPAPTTAPPSVTTKLCGAVAPGDGTLRVENLGGLAPGDTVTLGTGAASEKVTVTGLGDRTATCTDLSVSTVAKPHAVGETVVNIARTTRLKTLVAQCTTACVAGGTTSVALDPASVTDVTDQVSGGQLSYTFPAGNGNPWVVIDMQQTASGLIAQSGGYTATQPNYVVDHWSRSGAQVQANFWDDNILTDAVQSNLDKIGRGAVFEDSLELGSTQKWTWGLLSEFARLRGYDPTLLLPALLGSGLQASGTPAFELAGVGPQVREDYRQTMSDLHTTKYVDYMQRWAESHGLDFRTQSYGTPIASGAAAAVAGIPEGESLNFGSSTNTVGAEQDYRVIAGGAHQSGKNIVSVECCAIFQGGFRSGVGGPSVPGQFGQGGDGTQTGGRYSQGLLDSIYKSYAGGVNQLVWHGYAYRDAPKANGSTGRDGGTWPGYHPWDIFGVISVNDEFGAQRNASWPDYAAVNDSLARDQLVLRQGRSTSDLAVYYEDLGLAGSSVGTQQPTQHLLANSSATSQAGYTYEYVAPAQLDDPGLAPDPDGGLFGSTADYDALVLNNQTTISLPSAQRLLALAKQGLRVFVVGQAPTTTTGAGPSTGQLASVVTDLLAQPTVKSVATEADLPGALGTAGLRPTVTPSTRTAALGMVHRQGEGRSYDFIYNRSASTVEQDLTIAGAGRPYLLDTWTGKISPVARYTSTADTVTVHVRIAPHDKVVIALDSTQQPAVHATSTTADQVLALDGSLVARASKDGSYSTTFDDGSTSTATVQGLAPAQRLDRWDLRAQTWGPGANEYTTTKTDQPAIDVTAASDGTLPSWRDITTPVDLSKASGVGTYATTLTLPATWQPTDGAYLDLGQVLDTAQVTVNGTAVVVNQSDRGRIDLGRTLEPGDNTIVVRVATTMFNAVRNTGDSNYQTPDWQRAGLRGPVTLTPYRDTTIATTQPGTTPPTSNQAPTAPTRAASTTSLRASAKKQVFKSAKRVVLTATVAPAGAIGGQMTFTDGSKRLNVKSVSSTGTVKIKLPRNAKPGKHKITATYLGNTSTNASTSKKLTVTVVRR